MLSRTRVRVSASAAIAAAALTVQLSGASLTAGAAAVASVAPNACSLLSVNEASQLLGSPASSEAFTDLGFPVSPNTPPNPSYSQCRFSANSSRSEIRVIVNASVSRAPSLRIQAIAATTHPGGRVLAIDRAPAVWLPWTQSDLRGEGGTLDSIRDGDYIAVILIYVHHDPLHQAEDAMRIVLPRITSTP
jgi:hypothetical protein